MAEALDSLAFVSMPYFTTDIKFGPSDGTGHVSITSTEVYVNFKTVSRRHDHNVQELVNSYMELQNSKRTSSSSSSSSSSATTTISSSPTSENSSPISTSSEISSSLQGIFEYLSQKKAEIVSISCAGYEAPNVELLGAIDMDNRLVFISYNRPKSGHGGRGGFSVSHYPNSDGLKSLRLIPGKNTITVKSPATGASASLDIFAYGTDTRFIVMDIDGTVTRSDVRGYVESFFGKYSYTHAGLAEFLNLATDERGFGCQVVYLTSRPISHQKETKGLIYGIKSMVTGSGGGESKNKDGASISLPQGPLLMTRSHTLKAGLNELILKASESFKIGVLLDITRTYCIARSRYSKSLTLLSANTGSLAREEGISSGSIRRDENLKSLMDSDYLELRKSKYPIVQRLECYTSVISSPDCLGTSNIIYTDSPSSRSSEKAALVNPDASTVSGFIDREQTRDACVASNAESETSLISSKERQNFKEEVLLPSEGWYEEMCTVLPETLSFVEFKHISGVSSDNNLNIDYLTSLNISKPICLRIIQANCLFLIRMSFVDFQALGISDLYNLFSLKPSFQLDIVEIGAIYWHIKQMLEACGEDEDSSKQLNNERNAWSRQYEDYLYGLYQSFKGKTLDSHLIRCHVYNFPKSPQSSSKDLLRSQQKSAKEVKAVPKLAEKIQYLASDIFDLSSPFALGVGNKDADAKAYFKTNIRSILIINPSSVLKTWIPLGDLNNAATQASWRQFHDRHYKEFQGYLDSRLFEHLDMTFNAFLNAKELRGSKN